MPKNKIAFINSCFNPVLGWEKEYVNQAISYQDIIPDFECCFVLVNDGSNTDINQEVEFIASKLNSFSYIPYPKNQGKGFALRKGIESVNADYYCYTDVDFPYAKESMEEMVKKIKTKGSDIILGKRSDKYFDSIPFQRKIISKLLIGFNKYFLRLKYPDTQCGIKLINNAAKLEFLKIKTKGFLFEVEFIKKSIGHFNIDTVEVTLRKETQLKNVKLPLLFKLFKEYLTLK